LAIKQHQVTRLREQLIQRLLPIGEHLRPIAVQVQTQFNQAADGAGPHRHYDMRLRIHYGTGRVRPPQDLGEDDPL
jgi:hypothetical protein